MTKQSEDIMYRIYRELETNGLRRKFDKQMKKMGTQEKHKFKEVSELWEYAFNKVKMENKKKK